MTATQKADLNKYLPWLIGGAVVVGGLFAFGGDGQALGSEDPAEGQDGSGFDDGGDRTPGQAGPDGVVNSSRKSSRAAPDGRRDQPPQATPLTPPFLFPVQGYRIGRGFGWQSAVFSDGDTWHAAVDIGAPRGTPVRAIADGYVWDVSQNKGACGTRAQITHDGPFKFKAAYCHLESVIVGKGRVTKGQIIGYVGDSGTAQGTHLHFSMWVEWPHAFDPGPWIGLSGFQFVRNLVLMPAIVGQAQDMEWVPGVGWVPVQFPVFGFQFGLAA